MVLEAQCDGQRQCGDGSDEAADQVLDSLDMKDTAEKSAAAQVNLVILHPCAYVVAATLHLPIDLSVRSPQCEQSTCGPHLFQCQSGSQCVSNTQVLKYQTPRYPNTKHPGIF